MKATGGSRSVVRWALYAGSGLLIWVLQFLCSYVLEALVCARPAVRGAGGAWVTIAVGAVSAVALGATVLVIRVAVRSLRNSAQGRETEQFLHGVAALVGTISLFAIAWTAMAGPVPPDCMHAAD